MSTDISYVMNMSGKLQEAIENSKIKLAEASNLGKVIRLDDVHGRYIEYVKSCFPKILTRRYSELLLIVEWCSI